MLPMKQTRCLVNRGATLEACGVRRAGEGICGVRGGDPVVAQQRKVGNGDCACADVIKSCGQTL